MSRTLFSRAFFVGAALLVGVSVAEVKEASAQQAVKIAVVDLNQAMNEVEEGKTAINSLEKRFTERRALLEKKQKELQTMQEELERKALVMSEEAKKNKAKELQEKYMEFQQARLEAEQEMGTLKAQLQEDIAEKLKKVCATIAQKEGYTLIVEKQVVWYAVPQYDITNQVIKAYNAQKATPKK